MKVICICNEKGGTGKTTIAVNLALQAVYDGFKTLLIDADIQASAFSYYEIRTEKEIVPTFQCVLKPSKSLHRDIKDFSSFDIIFIDTGGRDSKVFRSAVLASEFCLIPMQPSHFDYQGVLNTLNVIEEAQTLKDISVCILLNSMPSRAKIGKKILEDLKGLKIPIFSTILGARVAFRESIKEGKGVTEVFPKSKAAEEIKSLWKEVKQWAGVE